METFTRLFGSLLVFVYHCFDRVVINGYLSGLSRPGQVVHFFQNVLGEPVIGKEVLSRRTTSIRHGSKHLPATTAFPSNGRSPRRARRIMCVPPKREPERFIGLLLAFQDRLRQRQ